MRKRTAEHWGIVFISAILIITGASVARAGNVQAGLNLAARYCDVCHAVERSLNTPNFAPPIGDLARHAGDEQAWLRSWLAAPHPALAAALSRRQIDDIAAYLKSLAPATSR